MKKRKLPFSFKNDGDVESNYLPKPNESVLEKFSPHSFYKKLRKDVVSKRCDLPFHLLEVERFVILDLETTGFSRDNDDIIEVGAIEVEERKITGLQFHSYVNSTKVGKYDERVHGLSNQFLADKPKIPFVLRQFYRFLEGAGGENQLKKTVVISHNKSFDIGFLNTKMKSVEGGYPVDGIECECICSMLMFKKMYENHRYDLDSCCHFFGIDWNGARKLRHGALIDSVLLARLFLRLLDVLEEVKNIRNSKRVGKKRKSEDSQHRKGEGDNIEEENSNSSHQPPLKKRKVV